MYARQARFWVRFRFIRTALEVFSVFIFFFSCHSGVAFSRSWVINDGERVDAVLLEVDEETATLGIKGSGERVIKRKDFSERDQRILVQWFSAEQNIKGQGIVARGSSTVHPALMFNAAMKSARAGNYRSAERNFKRCLDLYAEMQRFRSEFRHSFGASCNNFALCQLRRGKVRACISGLRRALESGSCTSLAISMNLQMVARLTGGDENRSVERILADSSTEKWSGWNHGLLFIRLNSPCAEKASGIPSREIPNVVDGLEVVSSGSGFFISKKHVLTNKHVVEVADGTDARALRVHLSANLQDATIDLGIEARVLAKSERHDLALLELDLPVECTPLSLDSEAAKLGQGLCFLGYPAIDLLGTKVSATFGRVSKLASPQTSNLVLSDATVNGGNSGGPVISVDGLVAGVCTAKLKGASGHSGLVWGDHYSGFIPGSVALRFVTEHVSQMNNNSSPAASVAWEEVIEHHRDAVCLITAHDSARGIAPLPPHVRHVSSRKAQVVTDFMEGSFSWMLHIRVSHSGPYDSCTIT